MISGCCVVVVEVEYAIVVDEFVVVEVVGDTNGGGGCGGGDDDEEKADDNAELAASVSEVAKNVALAPLVLMSLIVCKHSQLFMPTVISIQFFGRCHERLTLTQTHTHTQAHVVAAAECLRTTPVKTI